MKNLLIIMLLAAVTWLGWRQYRASAPALGTSRSPWVILTAYGSRTEAGEWLGEVAPFMDLLDRPVDRSQAVPQCLQAFSGSISGQEVMVVVTGIGKINASTCVLDVLTATAGRVKGLVFSGTAGMSPTSGTDAPESAVMLGDVCVAASAVDFDRQFYAADQIGSSAASPAIWADTPVGSSSGRVLADHLFQLASSVIFAAPPPEVEAVNQLYHHTTRAPRVWGPDDCLEVSGDLFWHDSRADAQARQLGSSWISAAPRRLVIATAMESSAVGAVISRWNAAHASDIPWAYVRSGSNFDQPWRDDQGLPAVDGRQSLTAGFTDQSRAYAIHTTSAVVLKMLEAGSI